MKPPRVGVTKKMVELWAREYAEKEIARLEAQVAAIRRWLDRHESAATVSEKVRKRFLKKEK